MSFHIVLTYIVEYSVLCLVAIFSLCHIRSYMYRIAIGYEGCDISCEMTLSLEIAIFSFVFSHAYLSLMAATSQVHLLKNSRCYSKPTKYGDPAEANNRKTKSKMKKCAREIAERPLLAGAVSFFLCRDTDAERRIISNFCRYKFPDLVLKRGIRVLKR